MISWCSSTSRSSVRNATRYWKKQCRLGAVGTLFAKHALKNWYILRRKTKSEVLYNVSSLKSGAHKEKERLTTGITSRKWLWPHFHICRVTKWLNPYTCYTQCRDAVCKHLVASIQGSAVSPAITRCDPQVYVEVSRSFSFWAPVKINDDYNNYHQCRVAICPQKDCDRIVEKNVIHYAIQMQKRYRLNMYLQFHSCLSPPQCFSDNEDLRREVNRFLVTVMNCRIGDCFWRGHVRDYQVKYCMLHTC